MKIVILTDAEAKSYKMGVKAFPMEAMKSLLNYYLKQDNTFNQSWEKAMNIFKEKTRKI